MSLLAGLLFAVIVSGQDTSRLVSAEVRAAAAPAAIAELAKQVGAPLEAAASMKDDIMLVRVDKVPLKSLMDKIASTLNAEWEQIGGGYRLVRTERMRTAEAAAERERLAGIIRTALDGFKKRSLEEGEFFTKAKADSIAERLIANQEREMASGGAPTAYQDRRNLELAAPCYRMMHSLVAGIDPNILASILPGHRLVYSDQPNRMQRALPISAAKPIERFIAEQKNWSQAVKAAMQRRPGQHFYVEGGEAEVGTRKIGKVLLSLRRHYGQEVVNLHLAIYDTKGGAIVSCFEDVGWVWPNRLQEFQQANQIAQSEEPLQFSGPSKEMRETLLQSFASPSKPGEPRYKFSQTLKEIFLNVDKYEPLSLLPTESLFELARIKRLNLVACLPDRMFFDITLARTREVKPAVVLANAPRNACEVSISDGWMLWKPRESSWTRATRSDRPQVANHIRSVRKSGQESLEEKARFAFRSGKEGEESLPVSLLGFLDLSQPGVNSWEWDTLRLYGSLSAIQLQALRSDQALLYRSLQPAQKEILRHMVFDAGYLPLEFLDGAEGPYQQQEEGGEMAVENQLQFEATEILPNGFTGNEPIRLKETWSHIAYGRPKQTDPAAARWVLQPLSAEDLAMELFSQERPEFFPYLAQQESRPKMAEFCTANSREMKFLTDLNPRTTFVKQLQENGSPTSTWAPMEKLSDSFRRRIEEALADIRQSYKDHKPPANPPNRGVPPP